jgi:hypothetical protein
MKIKLEPKKVATKSIKEGGYAGVSGLVAAFIVAALRHNGVDLWPFGMDLQAVAVGAGLLTAACKALRNVLKVKGIDVFGSMF